MKSAETDDPRRCEGGKKIRGDVPKGGRRAGKIVNAAAVWHGKAEGWQYGPEDQAQGQTRGAWAGLIARCAWKCTKGRRYEPD